VQSTNWIMSMKCAGVVVAAAVAAIALTSTAAFAQPFPFWNYWHSAHTSHGSPAPILAAGIPAFAALGGGAAVASLARRFRRRK
jgi:hypothetical protein